MLEILHHDAVVVAAIPGLRIVRAGADVLPQRLCRRLARVGRNGVVEYDVTVLLPEREIGSGEYRVARLYGRERALALLRRVGAMTAALMRATRSGSMPPVVPTIQRSNASKLGAAPPR